MTLPQTRHNYIPASSEAAIDNVKKLEDILHELPQINTSTQHVIHGGMYARTIKLETNVICCGAFIKVPTIIIIQGNVLVYTDNDCTELNGYNVFVASKDRKQAVFTLSDVYWTMIFKSNAKTIKEAEEEFTDEVDNLFSRRNGNDNMIIITGE